MNDTTPHGDAGEQFTIWCAWSAAFLLTGTTQALLLIAMHSPRYDTSGHFGAGHGSGLLAIALALCGLLYSTGAARFHRRQWSLALWEEPGSSTAPGTPSHWLAASLFASIVSSTALLPRLP